MGKMVGEEGKGGKKGVKRGKERERLIKRLEVGENYKKQVRFWTC